MRTLAHVYDAFQAIPPPEMGRAAWETGRSAAFSHFQYVLRVYAKQNGLTKPQADRTWRKYLREVFGAT